MTAGEEWRRGWRVVLGSALGLGTGFAGYHYTASLFIPHLSREFGWTRGQIAGAMAAALVGSLVTPFAGRLADRFGVRPLVAVCTLLTGLGYLLLATQSGDITRFALIIAGTAAAGLAGGALAYTRAVAGWFSAARGLALGVTVAGVSLFAIIAPPVLQRVVAAEGWRAGYLLLAAMAVGVGLPALLLLVRERRDADAGRAVEEGLEWRTVLRTRAFWLLAGMIALVHASGAGVVSQLAPLMNDRGYGPATAAWLISLLGLSVLAGRILLGLLLDRLPALPVGAAVCAMPALGCALLLQPTLPLPIAALAVAAVGVSQGAELDLIAFVSARWFGMRSYSTVFGSLISVLALSGAGGVLLFGWTFDATGGYAPALTVAAAAAPLGAALLLMIGRPLVGGDQPADAGGAAPLSSAVGAS